MGFFQCFSNNEMRKDIILPSSFSGSAAVINSINITNTGELSFEGNSPSGVVCVGKNNVSQEFYGFKNCPLFNSPVCYAPHGTANINLSGLFYNCVNFNQPFYLMGGLTISDFTNLNRSTKGVTVGNLNNTFYNCRKFNQPLCFQITQNTDMSNAFFYCREFDQEIQGTFPTALIDTFSGCWKFNQPIVINATKKPSINLTRTFNGCYNFNSPVTVSGYNYNNNVTFYFGSGVFRNCINFNQPLPLVSGMKGSALLDHSFDNCSKFNQPLNWTSIIVNDLNYTFNNCTSFNSEINFQLRTSYYLNLLHIFDNCVNFNSPMSIEPATVSTTSLRLEIRDLFRNCHKFNQPGYNFFINITGTDNITFANRSQSWENMFRDCWEFNQPITGIFNCYNPNWSYSYTISNMFRNCYRFNQNLDLPANMNIYCADYAFENCTDFNSNIKHFSARDNLNHTFANCISFNQPVNMSARVAESTFLNCISLNRPIALNFAYCNNTFKNCTNFNSTLTYLRGDTYHTFENCVSFNQPVSWKLSNNYGMHVGTFLNCTSLNCSVVINANNYEIYGHPTLNLSNFLEGCTSFNSLVSITHNNNDTNTTSHYIPYLVIDSFFENCTSLNKSMTLNIYNTSITSMQNCFRNCTNLSLPSTETNPIIRVTIAGGGNLQHAFEDCVNLSGNIHLYSSTLSQSVNCYRMLAGKGTNRVNIFANFRGYGLISSDANSSITGTDITWSLVSSESNYYYNTVRNSLYNIQITYRLR